MSKEVSKTKVAAMNLATDGGSLAVGAYSTLAAFVIATVGSLTNSMNATLGTMGVTFIAFLGIKKYLDES